MKSYRSFGLFGLVILMFGMLGGLITSTWTSRYVLAHLLGGGALLALYLFTHLETLKESVSGRRAQHGTNTIVYSLLTLAVLGLINYLGFQHSWRYDATEQAIFSIAPQTQQILDSLDREIQVYAFFREAEGEKARALLESYSHASDRFRFTMVDPDKDPAQAEQMKVTQYGTLLLTDGDDTTRITDSSEEALTNALIRFNRGRKKKIYFTTGHGEPELEPKDTNKDFGQLEAALENEGYEVEPLLLAALPDIPADADAVVIAGPQRHFLENERQVLSRFLDRGGKTMLMIDPRSADDLVPLLSARGIKVGNDVIVDQVMQLFAGPSLGVQPIVADYGSHPITDKFSQRTIFLLARSVSEEEEMPPGITVTPLARTSSNAWAESDVRRLFDDNQANLDDDDTKGPISIAVAATLSSSALHWTAPKIETAPATDLSDNEAGSHGTNGNRLPDRGGAAEGQSTTKAGTDQPPANLEGRIVVFGDSDWVNNSNLSLYFNQDLFMNAIGWLAGDEQLISIRPRGTRASRIVLTSGESWAVFYSSVLLLPELVLLAGLGIWWRRRR
ncbi:MAG: GldG family protein [Acidobacteriota bacterium]